MKDYLPIIIGVIWVAYTLYSMGQKKKAKDGSTSQSKPKREPSILEQILMGQEIRVPEPAILDYDEDEQEPVEEIAELAPEKESSQPVRKAFLDIELSQLEDERQNMFNVDSELEGILEIEDYSEGERNHFFKDGFDLRKAIIYNEVLNPPYIDFK